MEYVVGINNFCMTDSFKINLIHVRKPKVSFESDTEENELNTHASNPSHTISSKV